MIGQGSRFGICHARWHASHIRARRRWYGIERILAKFKELRLGGEKLGTDRRDRNRERLVLGHSRRFTTGLGWGYSS